MAFVSSFNGARVGGSFDVSSTSKCGLKQNLVMSATSDRENVSRRALLAGLVVSTAALVSAPELAQAGGEGPRYSFFGGESQSSPFVYSMKKGTPVYKPLSPEEMEFHKRIADESKERIEGTDVYISQKSWDKVRGELRLEMYNLRHSQERLIESVKDDSGKKAAAQAFADFKKSVEDLDRAATNKKVEDARKARAATLKALSTFYSAVGI
mmetsp:Transcript_5796/g.10254  ORF Transcript_5796/g.10254 Transcript_5796/m.10254 type:complete len:211 (-) Transcript_5796:636-1268(-)|eukprot:CAMPEP_0182445734 /NCGR_PEP_ID=MMETSP1172-20130603/3756_1 /TAXON_ID=708627 /ORGANISM="Timspurckia oligopyrenoides, Strain CCMP3278" /LENGTH=210 /DNA_ID=CAMNT_0024641553 /DNA_START=181 /DNA_END=813 /DNA_ORIENTATION=-